MKIFSDRTYLVGSRRHVTMLYPFWGKNDEDPQLPTSGRYDYYTAHGHELFELTSLTDADVAVLPVPWEDICDNQEYRRLASNFVELATAAGKQTLIFFWHDSSEPVHVQNSIIFRTSLYASKRLPNEYPMPAWSEDFMERYLGGQLIERSKRPIPVVGFCGAAEPIRSSAVNRLKYVTKRLLNTLAEKSYDTSRALRAQAMHNLQRHPGIETNFVVRDKFMAGLVPDNAREVRYSALHASRREYVTNIVDSDYVLCVRGVGNYSYRLYETLSCGRIPVLVNTDCSLPFDHIVNYKDYFVWVEEQDLRQIGERVQAFHERLSQSDFVELQRACRRLWETHLSPYGFFSRLETVL
ncbi:exostosin family protein [Candidatus Chloroploca sp. M-50]|uniref:Exostosin family protein n=1 Tax=Candidatus Chloroploca mongolica TaxID=2528176 RepID=A0ABS4D8H7_9CHLR|nr:exostosin family protein [Candidatus Chloroploca mongolica]MBP1465731.1 exostosin family protein [Candidatus Chloroploca mongolica]